MRQDPKMLRGRGPPDVHGLPEEGRSTSRRERDDARIEVMARMIGLHHAAVSQDPQNTLRSQRALYQVVLDALREAYRLGGRRR